MDNQKNKNIRVTGIGGIFFKCKQPQRVKEWYAKNLGLKTDEYGVLFEFRNTDNPSQRNYLQWSLFEEGTSYFSPSEKEFMINYRVGDLEALMVELKDAGVTILDNIETFEYGKFLHILDPEGNKIDCGNPWMKYSQHLTGIKQRIRIRLVK